MSVGAASGTNGSSSTGSTTSTNNSDMNSLTSNDFMKLLITQLQNQDPTQPVSNSELLGQLSQMRSLQSNIELSNTLKSFNTTNQISSAASFLGMNVSGSDAQGNPVTGTADRVIYSDGAASLGIGDKTILLSSLTGIDERALLSGQSGQ